MKQFVFIIILLTVMIIGCSSQPQAVPTQTTGNAVAPATSDPASSSTAKTFTFVGENFKFKMNGVDNPDMNVNVGDTVHVSLTSNDMPHDWVVDEFNAKTARVFKGQDPVIVEFVAKKKGTFEYYCSVTGHRANGMKGNLIVS